MWQAVKKNRPSSFLTWQLANVARWGAPEYLEVDERFTPLRVHERVRESADAPAEKQEQPCDSLDEAMSAVFEERMAPSSVIFAPPGGGKSTLLRHHQLQQARRLGDGQRLVFYAQLRDYCPEKVQTPGRESELPALAWLESEWRKETDGAPRLADFMGQGSLTLLLDGLNEIPRDSDGAYKARVGERQKDSARFADPGLLSELDRRVLMGGKPDGHWLPDETPLFEALARLAFHI